MVVMVGGKTVVPNGSNQSTITAATGGPVGISEEKQEVESVAEVEAEVIDDEGKEFSNYIENLPMEIEQKEGTPTTPVARVDPPGANSPAVEAAKAAIAAALADVDDDGGGKPAAKPSTAVVARTRTPVINRTEIDMEKDAKWLAVVDKLKEFKRINGHCNVPYHRPPNLTLLMSWCHSQRRMYRTGKLHQCRIKVLEDIGFRWNAPKRGATAGKARVTWEDRLEQLKNHKLKHGTLDVDRETLYEEEMALNQWCVTQRENYHSAKLQADRVAAMDAIGFEWRQPLPPPTKREPGVKRRLMITAGDAPPAAKRAKMSNGPPPADETEWVEMFEKLQKIKRKNKTLPSSFPQDKQLDRWVRHQKQLLRKEDLPNIRMVRLHKLGFALPPGKTVKTYLSKADAAAKASPTRKSPLLQHPTAKKPPAKSPAAGAMVPGAYPGMPWNPFMPPPFGYGPPGMVPPFGMPRPGGVPAAAAGAKNSPNRQTHQQLKAQNAALMDPAQAMQVENARLRAENAQLQAMHSSMMASMEEEKMVRRQGKVDLDSKMEKQNEIITIQGSTIKKQGQQIKELMDQMKDVVSRHKEQQHSAQEEERQRQVLILQQQQEQQRQEALRRQQEQQRQNELFVLRQQNLY